METFLREANGYKPTLALRNARLYARLCVGRVTHEIELGLWWYCLGW